MAKKDILVGYGVDFDAVAGWLGSYGGEDSPLDISRGMYAGEVGVPRLLDLFKKHNLRVTFLSRVTQLKHSLRNQKQFLRLDMK